MATDALYAALRIHYAVKDNVTTLRTEVARTNKPVSRKQCLIAIGSSHEADKNIHRAVKGVLAAMLQVSCPLLARHHAAAAACPSPSTALPHSPFPTWECLARCQ